MAAPCDTNDLPTLENGRLIVNVTDFAVFICQENYTHLSNDMGAVYCLDGQWQTDNIGTCYPLNNTDVETTVGSAGTTLHDGIVSSIPLQISTTTNEGLQPQPLTQNDDLDLLIRVIIIVASVITFLLLILICVLIYVKRRREPNKRKRKNDIIAKLIESGSPTGTYTALNDDGKNSKPSIAASSKLDSLRQEGSQVPTQAQKKLVHTLPKRASRLPIPAQLIDGSTQQGNVNVVCIDPANETSSITAPDTEVRVHNANPDKRDSISSDISTEKVKYAVVNKTSKDIDVTEQPPCSSGFYSDTDGDDYPTTDHTPYPDTVSYYTSGGATPPLPADDSESTTGDVYYMGGGVVPHEYDSTRVPRLGRDASESIEDITWVPWADQTWINTVDASRASVASVLPTTLPNSTASVTASTLSQMYVMPKHSRQKMKENKGPEELRVHQARMVNAVFYGSPNKFDSKL